MSGLEISLLLFIAIRELMFMYQTNKLLNKLMSRNYHDYEFTKNVSQTMKPEGSSLKEDPELQEDLAPIHGFGIN